jgi:hypothetical protein
VLDIVRDRVQLHLDFSTMTATLTARTMLQL